MQKESEKENKFEQCRTESAERRGEERRGEEVFFNVRDVGSPALTRLAWLMSTPPIGALCVQL